MQWLNQLDKVTLRHDSAKASAFLRFDIVLNRRTKPTSVSIEQSLQ